ncbi:conserved protein, unknown function [Hepatocystis sp. ex Piliocolobus tephrosceles]|nr:conserved protein, unknown function [Hepatocystis sp. ex Piliocolobus tephrosceles]
MGPESNLRPFVSNLFRNISEEIAKENPENVIYFMVDYLFKNYSSDLNDFDKVWNVDKELKKEKKLVIEFFKHQKLTTEIAKHFMNLGFDSTDSLLCLNIDILDDIEKFNKIKWLPGHKIRLQQMFWNIEENIKQFHLDCQNDELKCSSNYINL